MLDQRVPAGATRASVLLPPGLAFLVVLAWSTRYDPAVALIYDAGRYFRMATGLLDGSFGPLLGREAGLFQDPGYSIALAAWFRVVGPSVPAGIALNAVIWAGCAALFTSTARHWLAARMALGAGTVFALSPMLSSFAPKLFSELLAICGLLLAVWAWLRSREWSDFPGAVLPLSGLVAGVTILVLTKAAFYPLAVLVAITLAVLRRWSAAAAVGLAAVLALPLHLEVERGSRGVMAAAHQAAMVTQWPPPVALRCGVYSLSRNLGLKLFPEVEGACDPSRPDPGEPMAAINPLVLSRQWLDEGFAMRNAVQIAMAHPGRYALVCGVNLLGACWLEGFYPEPLEGLSLRFRTGLWVFKVLFSTALWCAAALGAVRAWRQRRLQPFVVTLTVPLLYLLAVQSNFLGAQRYFFPAIPLLYLLATLGMGPGAAAPATQMAVGEVQDKADTMSPNVHALALQRNRA